MRQLKIIKQVTNRETASLNNENAYAGLH